MTGQRGERGTSPNVVDLCAEGPDRCMDDLCRGSDVGLCGALSDRLLGIDDQDYYDPEETA